MNIPQRGLLILLKSAVLSLKLQLPDGFEIDSEEIVDLVKKHRVTTLFYQGAANCGYNPQSPFMKSVFAAYYKFLIHGERQMKSVQTVFDAFDENGIDYLPTKGCVMKALYPKPELRVMGDVDVFIKEEQLSKISEIVEILGFEKTFDNRLNLVCRNDALTIEFHKEMVSRYNKNYYKDVWKKVKLVSGHRYAFSTEDAFIHVFNHFARHFRSSGIGLRQVMDIYVYRKAYPDMDYEYIYNEMKVLKLHKFYSVVMKFLDYWFEDGSEDEAVSCVSQLIFERGSWGNATTYTYAKEVTKANDRGSVSGSRVRMIFGTIFPSVEYLTSIFDFLKKYPFLLPVGWVMRWIQVLRFRHKNIRVKLKLWKKIEKSKISEYQEKFKLVGLDIED